MWSPRNTLRCVLATLAAASFAAPAVAQPDPVPQPVPQHTPPPLHEIPQDPLAPPNPEACMDAFRRVRAALVENSADPLPTFTCGGVAITLRLDGAIVARAHSFDAQRPLDAAVAAARADYEKRLSPAPDAAAALARESELRRATLSLEVAGALVPVTAATFGEVDLMLAPGLDGVAVRKGDRVEGVFPAASMLGGKTPGEALASAISTILADASAALPNVPGGEAGALARTRGLTYYRFRVSHITEPGTGRSPVFLSRGMRIVPPSEVTEQSLRSLAGELARSLIGRCRIERSRVYPIGTYNPVTGRADTEDATPAARAVVAFALARYARSVRGADAISAVAASRDILRALLRPFPEIPGDNPGDPPLREAEPRPWDDPVHAALALLAIRELALADPAAPLLEEDPLAKIDAAVAGAFSPERGWACPDEPGRAVIAAALAARAVEAPELQRAALRAQAEGAVRALFRDTPAEKLAPLMPWLLFAELDLAGSKPIPAAVALREFRSLAWRNQIEIGGSSDFADLSGGIVFSGGLNPYPSWSTARVLDAAAVMLAHPVLTDRNEIFAEVSRISRSLRFIRQLSTDEFSAFLAVDRARAMSGIRAAPWDPRQPPEATAYSLMSICDSLSAMSAARFRTPVSQ